MDERERNKGRRTMGVKRKKEKERRALTSLMCRKVEDESSHTPKARRLSLKFYADRRTNHRTVRPPILRSFLQLLLLSSTCYILTFAILSFRFIPSDLLT